jgi:hypothetical protein
MVEAHAEEERACGVNLDGGCACGVDLNGGRAVETHPEEERDAWREPQLWAHGWRGSRRQARGGGARGGGVRRAAWTSTVGARWRYTRRRSKAPVWRRSTWCQGRRGGGAGASGCVEEK